VDKLYNETEPALRSIAEKQASQQMWSTYRQSYAYAKQAARSALIAIQTTQTLAKAQNLTRAQVQSGLPQIGVVGVSAIESACTSQTISDCVATVFRTYTAFCNNVRHPLWGSAFEPLARTVDPAYGDNIQSLRTAVNGDPLPNARTVSANLLLGTTFVWIVRLLF
jgi:hypothetical protein